MTGEAKQPNPSKPSPALSVLTGICLLFPLSLVVVLLLFSPNYRWAVKQEPSLTPFGADFLQDWIGGRIVLSEYRQQLYHSGSDSISRRWQHDREMVGFEWPEEKYFPMVYPPFHYLLISPLSLLPYRWAAIVWVLLMALAYGAAAWLLIRIYQPLRGLEIGRIKGWPLALATMIAFTPWIISVSMGQKGTWLLLLFTGTFLLLQSNRPFWAGLLFGLVAIKPQLGLVVGLIMMAKRQWHFVFGSLLSVGSLAGIAWWIEPVWWNDFFGLMTQFGDYVDSGGYLPYDSHSLWGGIRWMFPEMNSGLVKSIYALLSIGLMLMVFFSCGGLSKSWNTSGSRFGADFALLMFATVLISPHLYTYDLTLLWLPILILICQHGVRIGRFPNRNEGGSASTLLTISLVLMYLLAGLFPFLNQQTGLPLGTIIIGSIALILIFFPTRSVCKLDGAED